LFRRVFAILADSDKSQNAIGLDTFPQRGRLRDDIRPGIRILGFERRVVIAYAIAENLVVIHGIFYGGQDFEETLRDEA
jgi:toxin ParE1/3/4